MTKEVNILEYLTTSLSSDDLHESKDGEPEIEFEIWKPKPIDPWPEITNKLKKKK